MSELIRFECPQCRKSLSAKPQHAGRSTKCPACECLVKVPTPVAETEDFFEFLEADEPTAKPTPPNPRDELYPQLAPSADSSNSSTGTMNSQHDFNAQPPSTNIPMLPTPLSVADSVPPPSEPPQTETGTKPCPFCAEIILAAAKKCKHCGEFLDPVLIRSQSHGAVSATTPAQPDEVIIRRIHDWEHLSSILWIVLGAIQIVAGLALAGVPTMVGVLNVVGGIQNRKLLRRILNRDTTIPDEYQPVVWMVIVGIFNFVLGGVIGIGLTIFDFVIRDKVLSNRQLFNVAVATA